MKLSFIFLLITSIQVFASAFSQEKKVSIDAVKKPIQLILTEIEQKTDYRFVYSSDIFPGQQIVDLHVKDMPVSGVLASLLSKTDFTFKLASEQVIILSPKDKRKDNITVTGTVKDAKGRRIPGATVNLKGTGVATVTNSDGEYEIIVDRNASLYFYFVGYKRIETPVNGRTRIDVTLEEDVAKMDDVVIIGYGKTTTRLNTGSVSRITSEEIEKQPVGNVLQALVSKIPGVEISQNSGYASGNFNVTIRGQKNLLNQGSATPPLYVIDGIPLSISAGDLTNSGLNQNGFLGSNSGQSPLYSLNPNDIESIEILKDADATSIYGSRAANGVILITTKRGKSGPASFDVNVYSGITSNPSSIKLLNTQEYLEMRKEAFINGQMTPDMTNAPDLLKWDQNRYTDWQKEFNKGARTYDVQLAYSGGNEFTSFRFSGGYHMDNPPLPSGFSKNFKDQRLSSLLSIDHSSKNKKLKLGVVASYARTDGNLPGGPIYEIGLAPNAPALLNAAGQPNFEEYGFNMPPSIPGLFQPYKTTSSNFSGNVNLSYEILKSLTFTTNFGYTETRMDQLLTVPRFTQGPNPSDYTGTSVSGYNNSNTWITEPRINYNRTIGKGEFSFLLGATLQSTQINSLQTDARGFVNDNLLEDLRYAQMINSMGKESEYRFQGYFSRLNYNYLNRYIVNISGRRDGSSRFRGGDQMGNFGAVGAAWIFSEESFLKNSTLLSFGKLRASIGTTGSAAAGDYQYLKLWQASQGGGGYDGTPVINLYQPENPGFKWQVNKKMEAALELGFLENRISLTAGVYKERNSNMLVSNQLPGYTGFYSVVANIPALLDNSGFEFSLNTTNITRKDFNWTSTFNISLNRNKIVAFPGLENSSYSDIYRIGYPANIKLLINYTGVDPQTGDYTFEDRNGNGQIDLSGPNSDRYPVDLTPKFFGALQNTVTAGNWALSFVVDFKKQKGVYLPFNQSPGGLYNQPRTVLDRWMQPGDASQGHRYTTGSIDLYDFRTSTGSIVDSDYLRLQNVSVSYSFGNRVKSAMKAKAFRIYAQGQNLITLTNYKGQDGTNPSDQLGFVPQRIFTTGLQLTF